MISIQFRNDKDTQKMIHGETISLYGLTWQACGNAEACIVYWPNVLQGTLTLTMYSHKTGDCERQMQSQQNRQTNTSHVIHAALCHNNISHITQIKNYDIVCT